ncbi:uncharacterized protein LOC34621126 [Cyclospora cayetanensis]|uniref:Uncharacterized protein LOC34621126 n=1 Tax=Cyclospora cayetanensis TaxID=88456 RepID=A0A6P6RWP6_9EIME|nr:uncharacterized protein LOC34621126 [Cyclospora cayetanensis]
MQARFMLPAAARPLRKALQVSGTSFTLSSSAIPGRYGAFSSQLERPRFQSTATQRVESSDGGDAISIRPWEKPLIAEVYSQLRGQHIPSRTSQTPRSVPGAASEGGRAEPTPLPGWDFSPEDERGLRFGAAYMLLTLAWNRKFTRLRDLLVNANRAREGSKQVVSRVLSTIAADLSPSGKLQSASDSPAEGCRSGKGKCKESPSEKSGGDASTSSSYGHVAPENILSGLHGCCSPQLQQLLQHQVAFLAQRGLGVHSVVRPQRVVVDAVYGIVGCTRGSNATSTVLLQHGSLHVLLRRGTNSSSSSSLGTPATLYMPKPRSFDFEGAVAAAEAATDASEHPRMTEKPREDEGEGRGEMTEAGKRASSEESLTPVERRQQQMATEGLWRKRAREQMHDILKQPLTFRQFMNMCADCGTVLDRGFVVAIDFKLLCVQQLAIVDADGNIVMGSEEDEAAVHTLRLELNAKFDPNNSNFIFPAFEPSGWQLMDWNYAVGPQYPVDPREISNVVFHVDVKGRGETPPCPHVFAVPCLYMDAMFLC